MFEVPHYKHSSDAGFGFAFVGASVDGEYNGEEFTFNATATFH